MNYLKKLRPEKNGFILLLKKICINDGKTFQQTQKIYIKAIFHYHFCEITVKDIFMRVVNIH